MTTRKKGRGKPSPRAECPVPRRTTIKRLVPVHEIVYDCECWQCGAPFTSKRPDARYDSAACRSKAYRERVKNRRALLDMQASGDGIFRSPLYSSKTR